MKKHILICVFCFTMVALLDGKTALALARSQNTKIVVMGNSKNGLPIILGHQ